MRTELSDPALLGTIEAMVRRRVPAAEVDDIVQSALADAIASADAPEEPEALRRWLSGVVRHKVADFHRRHRRELALDHAPEPGEVPSHEERDLLRWAARQLPPEGEGQKTLEWMMHEADGEKLEAIAERERLPATRVRQRVSRMRAFFRERWRHELAFVAAAITVAIVAWIVWHREKAPPIAHDPPPAIAPRDERLEHAERLRVDAKDACAKSAWRECIDKLDEAKALDPAGDTTPESLRLRDDANRALAPAPSPLTEPSAVPAPKTVPLSVPTATAPWVAPVAPSARSSAPRPPSKKPTSFTSVSKGSSL